MAEINETIVTGNIFRKLIDEKNNLWEKESFWAKACDIEFDDGTMLEEKVETLQSKNSSQDTRLSNLETSDSTQNTKISNLETKVASIETNNSSQNANVSNISTKVNSHDTKISNLESKIGNYSIKVMSLSSYNSLSTKESNVLYFCY